MGAIGEIFDIAKIIFSQVGKFKKQKQERKKAISEYYKSIADTLNHTATLLRKNETPHGDCQKILTYAEQLPVTIGDVIGIDLAKNLSERLAHAHDVEYLIVTLEDSPDREDELAKLEKAAGYFDASADSLLASR